MCGDGGIVNPGLFADSTAYDMQSEPWIPERDGFETLFLPERSNVRAERSEEQEHRIAGDVVRRREANL
jgi:hypothetical protein